MVLTFQSASSNRSLAAIDLQAIFWRGTKLPKDVLSIQGFQHSIGGSPVVEKTQDGKITGDSNKKLRRVDVRFSFKGIASVREHVVTLSGSVQWEMLYRVVARLVPEVKSLDFKVTNTASRFYLMKQVNLDSIYNERRKGTGYSLELFESEISGFSKLLIRLDNGAVASVFANGTVVAQGKDLKGIEKRIKDILGTYKNPYRGGSMKKAPVATRRNLTRKRTEMTESRYERASSWTNVRNGYYVRPGPDKVPRFYAVPKNPALVRTKVVRAYANVGVNVPPATRRILGISAAIKPKNKKTTTTAARATNWNASPPAGMYVRPGPGGLPKFYKIPKLIKQGKKTVVSTYKKAGVKIPNRVRAIFSISPSPASGSASPVAPRLNVTNKGVFRVDGLACSRYKLVDLQKIASKMGIPVLKRKKEDLCRDIKKKMGKSTSALTNTKHNFVKNGVKYYILANEKRIRRNKHTKSMNSFKVNELKNMITAINDTMNVSGKHTKKNLINMLIERKRTVNAANNMFANFSALSSASSSNNNRSLSSSSSSSRSSSSPVRPGLNIAKNILGPGFTNAELQNFLNRFKKSPGSYNRLVREFKNKKPTRRLNARVNVEVL